MSAELCSQNMFRFETATNNLSSEAKQESESEREREAAFDGTVNEMGTIFLRPFAVVSPPFLSLCVHLAPNQATRVSRFHLISALQILQRQPQLHSTVSLG